ncbi:MAG TPA: carboxypeptidase regulatory-like domain-containing protein, partial [Candidatus Cloacimonadota bacterium]|nr:carboxypeptidase regulatory-like domain-containing protein [Candidatus Cloacimonadota bacterium]
NSSPTLGISSTCTVRVKNNGTAAQNNYTVKLLDADNTELASVAGPAINSQQIVEVEIPWTPTVQGTIVIHGKVELTGDQIPTNNSTRPMSLMVNPAGVISYTVGDGSQTARIPVDMWWRNSLFETIYFPNEMGGFIGQITGLKFYNQFNSNLTQLPITIWLGTTTLTSLNDGYIPSTQLTEVFNGPVDFPSGENIISIIFNEPYLYLDGNNLVMLVHRADTTYYSSSDFFKAQTVGSDRSRNTYSDSDSYDPANPPAGTLSGQFPMTTFMVIPGGVGHISGTVTNASNQPISGATVSLNNGQYSTTTNASGQYQLINVLPDTYTLAFSAHGYYEHTQTVVLEEDDDLTINVTLQLLPQVSVTGTVLASDTGAGISGAAIQLRGYEPYDVTTNAAGVFTIPNVFADHTYDYNISAIGYTSANGQVVVGTSNHNMGAITLNEVAYAPVGVTAEVNDGSTAVNLNWLAPDPNALEIVESFEAETFPPEDWSQIITNDGPPNALGVYPTWSRIGTLTVSGDVIAPTDGDFQAGLFWDYAHQDEWLITPPFNCPPSAYLRFDGYVYCGSTNGDHYYVKVSSDNGTTWTVLWDATAQTPGWNEYSSPITIDL